jgi:ribosomal protein S18 acetylase RimI-like enzyme
VANGPESSTAATIRHATLDDDRALNEIDRATWSSRITPAAMWPVERSFFGRGLRPTDVLVAVMDGAPVGYVQLGAPTPLPANGHVLEVQGLAVLPSRQRRGIGRQLMLAAMGEARARGVDRLRLRVLGSNPGARQLYASLGFEVEGILRAEFVIDGRSVDDVLMAISIAD